MTQRQRREGGGRKGITQQHLIRALNSLRSSLMGRKTPVIESMSLAPQRHHHNLHPSTVSTR